MPYTTDDPVLAPDVREAHGVVSRFFGLMMRKRLGPGEALDIRPCGSIHMMWMRFAIDAVFYDKQFRVTKVARNVRPWIGLSSGGKGARAAHLGADDGSNRQVNIHASTLR